jgi:hypothetical protein
MTGQGAGGDEPRFVSEADLDALGDAAFGSDPAGASASPSSELDAVDDPIFGPVGEAQPRATADRRPSLIEAEEMLLDHAAFTGSPYTAAQLAAAQQVLDEAAAQARAPMPATERGGQGKPIPAEPNDLLGRVVTKPGGRTPGFSEEQDRRIDAAYSDLRSLAESRLGMPRQEAVDHARRVFLECQHVAAQAKETKNDFFSRLEQRVAGYQAMSPLVVESKRAGGR